MTMPSFNLQGTSLIHQYERRDDGMYHIIAAPDDRMAYLDHISATMGFTKELLTDGGVRVALHKDQFTDNHLAALKSIFPELTVRNAIIKPVIIEARSSEKIHADNLLLQQQSRLANNSLKKMEPVDAINKSSTADVKQFLLQADLSIETKGPKSAMFRNLRTLLIGLSLIVPASVVPAGPSSNISKLLQSNTVTEIALHGANGNRRSAKTVGYGYASQYDNIIDKVEAIKRGVSGMVNVDDIHFLSSTLRYTPEARLCVEISGGSSRDKIICTKLLKMNAVATNSPAEKNSKRTAADKSPLDNAVAYKLEVYRQLGHVLNDNMKNARDMKSQIIKSVNAQPWSKNKEKRASEKTAMVQPIINAAKRSSRLFATSFALLKTQQDHSLANKQLIATGHLSRISPVFNKISSSTANHEYLSAGKAVRAILAHRGAAKEISAASDGDLLVIAYRVAEKAYVNIAPQLGISKRHVAPFEPISADSERGPRT